MDILSALQKIDKLSAEKKITLPSAETGDIVKVFLWDSFNGMKPLGDPIIAVVK